MIYLFGTGKRYKIVKDLLSQNKVKTKIIAIDEKKYNYSKKIFDIKYFLKNYNSRIDFLIISISDPIKKSKIFNHLSLKKKIKLFPPLISLSATIKKKVKIGNGSIIMDHAYIGENVNIKENCSIGVSTLISHDVKINSCSEVSHKSKIAGNVNIGKKCFLGLGSIVTQNLKLSDGCFIGAGVLIKKNQPKNTRITLKQNLDY
tara:strand:- start:2010 stop:2618 length:609 start_codon:yes stop_codon:yes gene_type:complete